MTYDISILSDIIFHPSTCSLYMYLKYFLKFCSVIDNHSITTQYWRQMWRSRKLSIVSTSDICRLGSRPGECYRHLVNAYGTARSAFAWSAATSTCLLYDAPLNSSLDLTFTPNQAWTLYYKNSQGSVYSYVNSYVSIFKINLFLVCMRI